MHRRRTVRPPITTHRFNQTACMRSCALCTLARNAMHRTGPRERHVVGQSRRDTRRRGTAARVWATPQVVLQRCVATPAPPLFPAATHQRVATCCMHGVQCALPKKNSQQCGVCNLPPWPFVVRRPPSCHQPRRARGCVVAASNGCERVRWEQQQPPRARSLHWLAARSQVWAAFQAHPLLAPAFCLFA